MRVNLRNKWGKTIGMFVSGAILIGVGIFFEKMANLVLSGLDVALVNHVINLETLPFYSIGTICVLVSILIGIFATPE
jgi:hypothetical protein